jgi:hypothetical protein
MVDPQAERLAAAQLIQVNQLVAKMAIPHPSAPPNRDLRFGY